MNAQHWTAVGRALCCAMLLPAWVACGGAASTTTANDVLETPREAWSEIAPIVSEASEGLTAGAMAFDVDGVAVLLKRTPGNPIVSTSVVIAGGVHDDRPEEAGLERLTLSVLEHGGPADRTKTEYAAALDAMGSIIGAGAGYDFASASCSAVLPALDETWALFAATLRTPAFREADLERMREQQLLGLQTRMDSPDSALGELLKDAYFAGHPYAQRPEGTETSVAGFTTEDLAAMHARLMTRDRLRVIVVGDVAPERVADWVRATFSDLPAQGDAPVPTSASTPFASGDRTPIVEQREGLPTTYLLGYFDAPSPADPDFAALQLGLEILSDRLFEEVRTRRNLTYAVASGIASRGSNTGYLYVTATDPETTVAVMLDTVAGMTIDGGIEAGDLHDQIEMYLTRYWMGLQQNGSQASTLAQWWMIGGGWLEADAHADRLRALTPEDVQAAMQRYVRDIRWAMVGDAAAGAYVPPSQPPAAPTLTGDAAPAPSPL